MTNERYLSQRNEFDQPGFSDRSPDRMGRDERGFLDRARDEVSSWFGDDDAERRRQRNERFDESRMGRDRSYDQFERSPRYRDEGYRRPYTGRGGARSGFGDDFGRPASSWSIDRGTSQRDFSAPAMRHDPDYSEWRDRQIEQLDRDYAEFRREHQARFDREFSEWRGQRQAKRQLVGNVREHMEVVGSDGQPIGKVDWVKGDKVILTKHDSADGRHHAITCSMVDRVEDDKVFLDRTAEEAKRHFERNDSSAFFEREHERDEGPHMLNRSFSGTY
jgi:hypothetical protein